MQPMKLQLRPHQERAVAAMLEHDKGQVIVPTGGGKTLKMIYDCLRLFQTQTPRTVVVVAPRILLAEQLSAEFLEFITNAAVFHVHSGETHHESSTRPRDIRNWVDANADQHRLIFTTYNSDRKSTRLNSSHVSESRMPSSA